MIDRLRRIPPGLGALLAVSALLAVTWACVTPAFQAPDEQRHYTYTQTLAEDFALPGDPNKPPFSTQITEGMAAMNADPLLWRCGINVAGVVDWATYGAGYTTPRQ